MLMVLRAGMDAWLTKPCSKTTLISVVREAKRSILDGVERLDRIERLEASA